MPLHTWRRQHGGGLIAQVEPLEGMGTWQACAWMTSDPTFTVRGPRQIGLLVSAQALADHLARKTFRHTCDFGGTCGDWMFWPKPDDGAHD
jgi:hypothetical protein